MFSALCRIFVIGRIFGSIFLPNIRFRPKKENPFSVDHYDHCCLFFSLSHTHPFSRFHFYLLSRDRQTPTTELKGQKKRRRRSFFVKVDHSMSCSNGCTFCCGLHLNCLRGKRLTFHFSHNGVTNVHSSHLARAVCFSNLLSASPFSSQRATFLLHAKSKPDLPDLFRKRFSVAALNLTAAAGNCALP
jgi:hypothetical protein